MRMKAIASVLAISSAILFGGSAYAQTTVGGMSVSADDLPKVQERCDQLSLAETAPTATESEQETNNTSDGADATVNGAEPTNEIADATSAIDLDSLTLEACTDAGLIKKAP